jgi:hypothetical protein
VNLAGQPHLGLIHRYETRLHRMFQRALQNLFLLRALPDTSVPNEPNPISGQTSPDLEPPLSPREIPPP